MALYRSVLVSVKSIFQNSIIPPDVNFRCSVSSVVLELLRMGISDVMSFDFMKAPSEEALKAAIRELRLLGAIEDAETGDDGAGRHYALTETGQLLVAFPIDPKLAKYAFHLSYTLIFSIYFNKLVEN